MARRAALRASDADRELVTQRLQRACTEGRLAAHELEDRVGRALSARTYGDLDRLVADLPLLRRGRVVSRRRERHGLGWVRPAVALAIAVPVVVAIAVVVAFAITGVLATWAVWLAAGWLLLRRRRRFLGYRGGWARGCRRWQTRSARIEPTRGYWA